MAMIEKDYEALAPEDFAFAKAIVKGIEDDPHPSIKYKYSRPVMNLKHMIETSCELYADHVAFYQKFKKGEPYQTITYKETLEQVYGLGTSLYDLGLTGEKISIVGENCSMWAMSYLAITGGIGVAVPLDKELNPSEMEQLVIKGGVTAVICKGKKLRNVYKEMMASGRTQLKILIDMDLHEDEDGVLSWWKLVEEGMKKVADGNRSFIDAPIDATALAVILFTSGTTGVSKGVMLNHRNLCTNLMVAPTVLLVKDTDIFFSVLPIHHTYECTCGFLMPLYKGAAIAYCEGLKYITKNLEEVKPTLFLGVPALFETLYKKIWKNVQKQGKEKMLKKVIKVNRVTKKAHIDLGNIFFKQIRAVFGGRMRIMICGGAAINPDVLNGLNDFGILALQGYGLTESSPLGALNPDTAPNPASIGRTFPNCQIKILNPDEDGIGEICLKGSHIMMGYYEMPEETAKVMTEDGWFKTGDIGYMDEAGYTFITGRSKNVIITKNGKNVFPEELEYYISNIPFVNESMVFAEETKDGEDITIVANIQPDMEEVGELFGADISDEELKELLWKEIDKINQEQPFFKQIKKVLLRRDDFIHNTSKKLIRFNEDNKRGV